MALEAPLESLFHLFWEAHRFGEICQRPLSSLLRLRGTLWLPLADTRWLAAAGQELADWLAFALIDGWQFGCWQAGWPDKADAKDEEAEKGGTHRANKAEAEKAEAAGSLLRFLRIGLSRQANN